MDDRPGFEVLVADDCDQLRSLVADCLGHSGFAVTSAATGIEAVQALRTRYFDVIITDVLMPDADGLEVMREVRERYPSSRIVAMTGGSRVLDPNYCLQLAAKMGAHAMLLKPFTPVALIGVVRQLLDASVGE